LNELPAGVALNLNVPNRAYDLLRGVRRCRLARFGAVQMTLVERDSSFVRMELQDTDIELEPDSDDAALALGYVSVTPLRPFDNADGIALPFPAADPAPASGYAGQST
jgi:5'-nucleotidase